MMTFKTVSVESASGNNPVHDVISLEKQIQLLAGSTHDWVNALKSPTLAIELDSGIITFHIGNVAREETFVVDLDQSAMAEWSRYVSASLDAIDNKPEVSINHFLQAAFDDADIEKPEAAAKALGLKLGEAVLEQAGIHIGNGPEDHSSIMIFSKLAHALLQYAPSIQQRSAVNSSTHAWLPHDDAVPSFSKS